MSDIKKAYALILSEMSKFHDILMDTVDELDAIRNIEIKDRTKDQKVELDRILRDRKPYENALRKLEEARYALWCIYEM